MAVNNQNTIFPHAIPVFPTHRNLLDDVDARHINALQDEVTSVADTLGENPQISNDTVVATQYIMAAPDPGGTFLSTPPPSVTTGAVSTVPVDHGTVNNRLDAIEHGYNVPWGELVMGSLAMVPFPEASVASYNPQMITAQFPHPAIDPYHLYNGVGMTVNKTGFWAFNAKVVFTVNEGYYATGPDGDPSSMEVLGKSGYYAAALAQAGITWPGTALQFIPPTGGGAEGYPKTIILNCHMHAPIYRGTPITLQVGHTTTATQVVQIAYMNGVLLREFTDWYGSPA